MKVSAESFSPFVISFGRLAIGSLVTGIFWFSRKNEIRFSPRLLWPVLFVGVTGCAFPFVLQPHIIHVIDNSSFTGMMVSLVPLYTIVISIPMLKVWPSRSETIGVVGGFIAVVGLFYDGLDREFPLLYVLLSTVTPFCFAISNVMIKKKLTEADPLFLCWLTFMIGSLLALPFCFMGEAIQWNEHLNRGMISLIVLGCCCTGLPGFLFFILIQRRGPLFAGVVSYIIPVVSLMIGAFFGETISLIQAFCLGLIVLMVAIVHKK